jgi:hypothetical protein
MEFDPQGERRSLKRFTSISMSEERRWRGACRISAALDTLEWRIQIGKLSPRNIPETSARTDLGKSHIGYDVLVNTDRKDVLEK